MEPPPAKKRRHRFQKVDERVSNLETELTLHAKTAGAVDEASTLTFKEELSLQAELTTLDSFQTLFRSIQALVTTTPQLLHHLPKVVKRLQTELKEARDDAADPVVQRQRLVPVLKLVTALARELGKEFYPHFAGVLPLVVAVVDTKDPELSTQVFKTLTMAFNYLRVQLLADMDAVHKCYFPLLGHPREFVRNFAAQTLAVLLRRLESPKAMRKYLRVYLTALVRGSGRNDAILRDGSAKLMFALVKNVNHGFHSRMREVLLFLLGSFRPKTETVDETELEQQEAVFDIVEQTCGLMMKHTDPDHSGNMLEYLVLVVTKVTTLRRENDDVPTEADDLYLSRTLKLLLNFLISRFGKLVSGASNSSEVRVPSVHKVCASLVLPESKVLISRNTALRDVLMNTFEAVWRLYPAEDADISSQVKAIFDVAADENDQLYWKQKLMGFLDKVLQNSHVTVHFVEAFLIPNALRYGLGTLAKTDVSTFSSLVCKLGDYVGEHEYEISESACVVPANSSSRRWLLSFENINASADAVLFEAGRDTFKKCFENTHDAEALAVSWKFCKSLELVRVDDKKLIGFLAPLVTKCDKQLKSETSTSALATLRAALWQLLQISKYKTKSTQLTIAFVEQAITGKKNSFTTLSTLLTLINMESETHQHEILTTESLPSVASSLFTTLRSPAHALRLVSLQLLAQFKRLEFIDAGEATLSGPCDLLDVAVELERACDSVSVATEREVMRLLTRVKILCRSPQTPEIYKKIALNHLHGLYHVKFSTIWPHVADAVETAVRQNFNEFWPCISAELLAASIRHEDQQNGQREEKESNVTKEVRGIIEEFEQVCMLERGEVPTSSATDAATHHNLLWKGMSKFADLVEAKTKFMVPLFLTFLRDQYLKIYTDELDTNRLEEIDQALLKLEETRGKTDEDAPAWRAPVVYHGLTTKVVRGKFVDQLKLFSVFRNMKGAYSQQLLHDLFFDWLMKSDEMVSKLALQCLYAFGSRALVSYKTQLNRLVDSSSFREELTSFKVANGDGVVLREHREELLPILLRLLYSKCVSKKGRNNGDTVAARRAAILSYLASLEAAELASFVELVVRAFDVTIDAPEDVAQGVSSTVSVVKSVPAVAHVQPSRVLGFLNLLEDLINQLGVKLAAFVPQIADVLLAILQTSISSSEDDDTVMVSGDTKEKDQSAQETVGLKRKGTDVAATVDTLATSASMKKQIRMLTYRRLSELVDTFDTLVLLQPWVVALLETSRDATMRLPNAVVGADKASALLEMLVAIGRADRARQWLPEPLVLSVITCLSAGLTSSPSSASSRGITPEILDAVLQFMGSLLDGDEFLLSENDGDEATSAIKKDGRTLLVPHISFVLEQFVLRFQAKAARYANDRYAGSSKKELTFLCRLSYHLDGTKGDIASAAHDLFQLLLPFLLRNHQTTPKDKENLLEVLANLVPKLSEPKKHVLALARLLAPGPNCISDREPRQKLVVVFAALGAHPALTNLAPVAAILEELNAYDTKHIEETDYERRLVALNQLNTTRFAGFMDETHLLAPLVAQCLQCMHDGEFAVRSAALAGLTTFIDLSAGIAKQKALEQDDGVNSPVLNALESLVMPCVRASLRSTDENARRGFVTLLGSLADHHEVFAGFAFIPADLVLARNKEDPEADFFYNITHIQAHRRRRALQRLGALMDDMATKANAQGEKQTDVDGKPTWFLNSTVNGIILPLVLHFVYETHAKSQESLRSEAAACVGSAAGLLGWSHYLALLRRLLKSIDGHVEVEEAIILSICSAIDHFHFEAPGAATQWRSAESTTEQNSSNLANVTPEDKMDEASSKVQDNMETQILPMLYSYLFKGADSKKSSRSKNDDIESSSLSAEDVSVRVPLALAVVKVLRRLRADTFHRELPKLLLRFANLLKSKDEAVRASARSTLVKIAVELGARFLLPIVEELRHTLRDGYMVHVLSFTVHALLEKLPDMLQADGEAGLPRKPQSLLLPKDKQQEAQQEASFASPLDACVPSLMDMLTAELFQGMMTTGEAAEAAAGGVERKSAHKSKMKEARSSSGRSLDSLELLARSLPFLPNPSIHAVVSALIQRFQATDAGAQATAALQEAFKRVTLGLAKNPAVESSYVFLYAYNVLSSSLESFRPTSEKEKEQYAAGGSNTELVTSWLVSEKSAAATKLLAARVNARDAARVTMQQQVTGFDKLRQQQQNRTKKQKREEAAALAAESTAHLKELLNFGVFLVFSFLRRSGAVKDQADDEKKSSSASLAPAELVDPLVPLLMRCTGEARSDRAIINSLKCLGSLLPRQHELPALLVARTPLVDRLFKILQKAGAATRNEMVQTCYRTLTSLLKQQQGLELAQQDVPQDTKSEALRLTESQLRVLLSFLRADLDEQDHQNATFALLKAIVNSRLVISEVYDVMMRVGELLVQSDGPGARANCASIYLTFVLEYPLGNKRLLRHLKFLVDNLTYDHATGRSAVLEALRALLSKLPQDLVNTRSQFFFLPLVLRLANDEAAECRNLAKTTLTTLVRRLGNKELNECVLLLGNWWSQATKSDAADAVKLLGTAAQVTTLILETRPEFFERTAPQVLQSARTALERSLHELQTVEDSNQVQWQPVYHVCVALRAFSEHLTGTFEVWLEHLQSKKSFLDVVVLPLLQYPHAWVRLASIKLLTSYVGRRRADTLVFAAPVKRLPRDAAEKLRNGAVYLQRPGRLFAWASAICKLLEAPSLNDELASEILTAMPFLCEAMEALPDIPQDMTATDADAVASVELEADVDVVEEEDAAASEAEVKTDEGDAELQRREEEEKKEEHAKARTPIGWLLTRLSYVARGSKCSNEVQALVFKLFAALLHSHDTEFAQHYVVQFINPLYRASSKLEELQAQQEQVKLQQQQRSRQGHKNRRSGPAPEPVAPPESALLAQEVLQLLEGKLGATPFLEAYSFVQRKMAAARAARKLQRRTEAVSDPQRAAQRRMQKNEQKRRTKQMRKRKHAVLKGSTSAAVRPTKVLRPGAE
ncbi:U3 snoRNP protein [Phytophthora boehmeriae]|uniref:U3 snoRNP protein n=1 Tax=Phytophthora boehmeriae TaxID=109152 RepID=A0A8T1X6U3_9STRA|nr:U3 snoRNP protein [Phytophthora boehmeriae]